MKKPDILCAAIILLTVFFPTAPVAQAQGCYVQKDEASGFDVTPYLPELEAKACELIAAFDSTDYADSFKVFTFGFYAGMEHYDGYSYPQAFLDMKAEVGQESPYFLLIGRQSDRTGIFTRFWVEVKLPSTGSFQCLVSQDIVMLKSKIQAIINNRYLQIGKDASQFQIAESAGMDSLGAFVLKQVECCYVGNRSSCSGCYDDSEFQFFLEDNGFTSINIGLDQTDFTYPNDVLLEDFAQKKLSLNGEEWDIHNLILQSLQEANSSGYSAKGVIMDNESACTTNFINLINSDYYCEGYDVAIVAYIWSNTTPQGQALERRLFLKYCFNITVNGSGTLEDDSYGNNNNCEPGPFPTDPDVKYAISFDEPGTTVDGHYYEYIKNSQGQWVQGSIVNIQTVLNPSSDFDYTWNDSTNYNINDYAPHALERTTWSTTKLLERFDFYTSNNPALSINHQVLAKQFFDKFKYQSNYSGLVEFGCNSDVSRYFSRLPKMKTYFTNVMYKLSTWFSSHNKTLTGFMDAEGAKLTLPSAQVSGGIRPANFNDIGEDLELVLGQIVVGGIQGWELRVVSLKEVPHYQYGKKKFEVEVVATIVDRFGVGVTDRDQILTGFWGNSYNAMTGSNIPWVPGICVMWILQHNRNFDCLGEPPCYRPFIVKIHVHNKFTFFDYNN